MVRLWEDDKCWNAGVMQGKWDHMAIDCRKCAEQISENIGGGPNVISAAQCAISLHLVIADKSKVNKEALEKIDGIEGVLGSNGQLQLVIGTGTIDKVYDEFLSVTGASATGKVDVKDAAAKRMPWLKKALKVPSEIFIPILPAIAALGLLMGLVETIPKFAPAFGQTGWFAFLDLVANTAFAMLPVIVAISAARVFGGNIFLGAIIGLMMVHPALLNAWDAAYVKEVALRFDKPIPVENFRAALEEIPDQQMQTLLPGGIDECISKMEELYDLSIGIDPALIGNLPTVEGVMRLELKEVFDEAGHAMLDDSGAPVKAYVPVLDENGAIQTETVNLGDLVWDKLNTHLSVGDSEAVSVDKWSLFGNLGIAQAGYQGHVISVILAVFFMCLLEKKLHRIVPANIDLFVTPLVTVLVTAIVTFLVIGPIFSILEKWVLDGASWLISVGYGIGAAVIGAFYPVTVVIGLHHMYNVIEADMIAQTGLNTWMPIASAAYLAQFGACLAVVLRANNARTKFLALPSSLSASLGIIEPAIYGINLRFMKPFVCGMIGGAVGALFASWVGFGTTTYGATAIPGIPAVSNIPMYLVELVISAGIAFVLTLIVWREDATKPLTDNVDGTCGSEA